MKVVRGYKTELDLNNEQRTACMKHAGCARYAYNWGLARSIEVYRTTNKHPTANDLHKELNRLKAPEFPWMYEVSKCAMQEALRDLEAAYKNFFRRAKLKKLGKLKGKVGFPKFKSRNKAIGGFTLTGSIHVYNNTVQLPRLGTLRLKEDGFLPTNTHVLSATVSEKAGRWYVSIQVQEERASYQNVAHTAIGVDLGIKTLATLSDGNTFENPRALKQHLKRLKRLERRKSKREKGSQNRQKTRQQIARLHARVANIRRDAAHKLTSYLTKNFSHVALEDLNTAGMLKNHKLAQAVADSNFGEIKRQLLYKSQLYGTHLTLISRWFPSSQLCSNCGWRNETLTLSDRVYVCRECGYVADRDYNAAQNILVAASFADTLNACGVVRTGSRTGGSETGHVEAGTNPHLGLS